MCVIIEVPEGKDMPSLETLEKCETHNKDGGGFAYTDGTYVHWEKGVKLTAKYIYETLKDKPGPKVIHFRIATSGGVRDSLCHPFPLSKEVETWKSGKIKGGVLFHNGVWSSWKEVMLARYQKKIKGDWSDTRFITALVSELGEDALDLISGGNRFSILYPDKIVRVGSWDEINGCFFSNKSWDSWNYKSIGPYANSSYKTCSVGACVISTMPGKDTCWSHSEENQWKVCAFEKCYTHINKKFRYCPQHYSEGKKLDKAAAKEEKKQTTEEPRRDSTSIPFVSRRTDFGKVKSLSIDEETGAIIEQDSKLLEIVESCTRPRTEEEQEWADYYTNLNGRGDS